MNSIANIATTPVDVYLGPVGSDITNLASWHCLGWCKAGQTKLSTSDVRQVKTARGLTLELASKYQFRAEALETTGLIRFTDGSSKPAWQVVLDEIAAHGARRH